jgi:hypothetical protein
MIFKIDGCDQMWCPQCSTAFSWSRGTIETGRIHNPLYFEYMRKKGAVERTIGDIPCGGMPTNPPNLYNMSTENLNILWTIIRWHGHIELVVIRKYTTEHNNTLDMRIKFMMNEMSEDKFKHELQLQEKHRQKSVDIVNVLNTYQIVTSDTMRRLYEVRNIDEAIEHFNGIRIFTNDRMAFISKMYNCVTPRIAENFIVITLK